MRLPCVRPGPPRPPTVQDPSLGQKCSPVGGQTHLRGLPRPPDADVAPAQWQGTTVVPPTNTCVTVARPQECSATVALPRQPCADVAQAQWQGTTVVPRTYSCAVVARPSGRSAAQTIKRQRGATSVAAHHRGAINVHMRRRADSPMPPWRQFSGRAPSWCRQRTRAPSWRDLRGRAPPRRCPDGFRAPAWPWCILQANIRGTMAGSAPGAPPTSVTPRAEVMCHRRYSPPHVSLANLAVSPGRHRGATLSVTCRLGAHVVGLVVWARPLRPGVVGDLHGDAPPWCYGCDARPALTEPGGT